MRHLRMLFCIVALAGAIPALCHAAPPNILIVIGDDATYSDLPLYGGQNLKMPQLDRLASQGMRFNSAYVAMSMCTPCRTELYTGLYPLDSGACWNHSDAKPGTQSIVHYLKKLGYRVGIAGKVDVRPRAVFPFEMVGGFERGCVKETADWDVTEMKRFLRRDPSQPFCLVIGLVVPHVPWTVGDPSHFDPMRLKLPPYLADTPETREDFTRYLAELEVLDQQLGDILAALDETGQAGNTLVIFTSEQGAQFPGCKWTNWEQGVHTGFVVRWPGKVKPGSETNALIQYADVLPTLIEAAGGDPSAGHFDGRSFLGVLLGRKSEHRKYVYNMHNNVPEGPSYPIRAIRTRQFHYIRNLTPESLYIEKHLMQHSSHNKYWPSWMWDSASSPRTLRLVTRYMLRPTEELYRVSDGALETINLAGDPRFTEVKERLRAELDRWMRGQKDSGAALDTQEAFQENKKANRAKAK